MKKLVILHCFVSFAMSEFQWFLPKDGADCEKVPREVFTGAPIALKGAEHFVCHRDTDNTPVTAFERALGLRAGVLDGFRGAEGGHWHGENFKEGDCGDRCCDLIPPVGSLI